MAQLIRKSPSIFKTSRQHDAIFVKASDLQFEGNWENYFTCAELKESCTFEVSGDCQLPGTKFYAGQFMVGVAKHHTMGKVKTEISSPKQEPEYDLTDHSSGKIVPIEMGVCAGKYVKFSLTSAEPYGKLQKGLIIYGVTFTSIPFK